MRRDQCAAWETGRSYWIVIAMASPDAPAALLAAPFSYSSVADFSIALAAFRAAPWCTVVSSQSTKILACRKIATLVNDFLPTGVN
jgi:hypothetical protein